MAGTVADVVGQTLATLGVGHCFGVVGSGNFRVTNALRAGGVPFTATRHEAGAATMADAYARMSGQVALLSVHQGCGLTNAAGSRVNQHLLARLHAAQVTQGIVRRQKYRR